MHEYGFSLTGVLLCRIYDYRIYRIYDSVLIFENVGQWKPVFSPICIGAYFVLYLLFNSYKTAQNMREYGFSLTGVLLYRIYDYRIYRIYDSVLIFESVSHWKPIFSPISIGSYLGCYLLFLFRIVLYHLIP